MTRFSDLISGHRTYKTVNDRRKQLQGNIRKADANRLENGLTICTVSFRTSNFLERSVELLRKLNPPSTQLTKWLVMENTPEGEPSLSDSLPDFQVVRSDHTYHFSSYGHASGFNELLPLIKTRFALFIDPDCFIIRPNWVTDVLEHMQQHDLAFFGTPTHPTANHRFRYFPSPICMFVDLSKASASELDFTPPASRWSNRIWFYWILIPLGRLPKPIYSIIARLSVNQLQDVGYRIYRRFKNSKKIHSEVVTPVFKPPSASPLGRIINRILPDRFNVAPKKAGYTTLRGFKHYGLHDGQSEGWEEFLWNDSPFAFHTRGVTRDTTEREEVAKTTIMFLDNLPVE
jgi:hypothetical protein